MNILFVCHRFPYPPRRGGKIRPFNIIKHFSKQGHRVTVASIARSESEAREGEGIRDYCEDYILERINGISATTRMISRLPSRIPSSMGYFYSPRLKRRIQQTLAKTHFDLVFVHCSSVAPYVEHVQAIPKMLDFGDMDSQKWLIYAKHKAFPMSLGYWVEGTKLQRAEILLARKFDYCTCTTKAELKTLNEFNTGTRTAWFPNGVDASYFHPADQPYDSDTVCFVGRMDYFPNQQAVINFCETVLPLIRSHKPSTKLLVVGANPSKKIRKLSALPGVSVMGSVPDVRPYVHGAALTVAPLGIARGTQNKILESLAMGVPVVASEQAAAGVDAIPGKHFLTASMPSTYADSILRLMEDTEQRMRFSKEGRDRVLLKHNWKKSLSILDKLVDDCLSSVGKKSKPDKSRLQRPISNSRTLII